MERIYNWLKEHPKAKIRVQKIIENSRIRPRWWIRNFVMPFLIKKGKGAFISNKVRRDLYPYHPFILGVKSIVEQNATLNNAMGQIIIGDHSRIGIGTVVLGETIIGNYVSIGQHCLISGLNHNYEDIDTPIDLQGVYSDPVIIKNDVMIGANSIICAGITIGTHCFISAGSVVRQSVPDYSLVAGNPAKVVFNLKTGEK